MNLPKPEKYPTRKEWLIAFIEGLEHEHFTGETHFKIHWNRGGITRLRPMVEVSTT